VWCLGSSTAWSFMFAKDRFACAPRHEQRIQLVFARFLPWFIVAATVLSGHAAAAHGIAGNRLFPGTLSLDDPAVGDEFAVTPSWVNSRAQDGSAVVDRSVSWQFTRLLVPNLAVVVSSGFIHRDWAQAQRFGFDTAAVALKGLLYESDPHEVLISAELSWGIGASGSPGVGASHPNTFQPALYFGKGLGDLPDSLGWLRPFAVTGWLRASFRRFRNRRSSVRAAPALSLCRYPTRTSRSCVGAFLSSTALTT
jgi:hypothetical protein